ncbi:MAG: LPXTG cell wall anchor domain-containing protein [Catenulispora sp.]|nr:LPXTG cell wall anchor domain-containing protein [Catenulispora sp.]
MDHSALRSRRPAWRATVLAGAFTAATVALAASAPTASADSTDVKYGGCSSSDTAVAAAPPDYTTTVTLTPQGSGYQAGKPIKITWHYSESTAPPPVGIPAAKVATAKGAILIGGAATDTVTTDFSAAFPPAAVPVGGKFQIPDLTATFTPKAAGTYTLTPGDNEQDANLGTLSIVIKCKASGAKAAATITVAAGTPGSGDTSSSSATTGSSTTSPGSATTSTSTLSTLPHTGFDGRWMIGAAGLAAVLGGGGLAVTRRRRGSHG